MNDTERWAAAVALALAAHFFILQPDWIPPAEAGPGERALILRLAPNQARLGNAPGLDLRLGPESSADEARLADRRRKAYERYLEEIGAAVHARRFDYGRRDLIGVAVFSFLARPDGSFDRPELISSSGDPELDRAAALAVAAAGGKVKRPPELAEEEIVVILPVKYQYGLR